MRLTNLLGAVIALFLALGFDYAVLPVINTFVRDGFSGDAQIIAYIGMAIVFTFITLGLPIMIAVEDSNKISE